MSYYFRLSLMSSLICLICLTGLADAQQTFTDGTFNNSDWSLYTQASGTGSSSAFQITTGGDPGQWREVENISNNDNVYSFSYLNSATYTPSTSGSINYVSGSFDFKTDLIAGWGQGAGIALRQNGQNYWSNYDLSYPSSWKFLSFDNLTASSFSLVGAPNAHPNFSTSGSEITFGFLNWNIAGYGDRTTGSGFDNYSLTVSSIAAVPEASSVVIALLGLGLPAAGLLIRRRIHQ